MSLMSEEWVGMVKDSEAGLIKQNAKINLWDQLYKLDINAVYLRNGAKTDIETIYGIHEIGR